MSDGNGDKENRIELDGDDDLDLTEVTASALMAAKRAFEAYLDSLNLDAAYWDTRFTAWLLDCNFERRLEKVEIEGEVKE